MPNSSPYDDEYSTCASTYASLRIFNARPDAISNALDLRPSHVFRKGERWETRAGKSSSLARKDGWFLTSKGAVQSRDVRRHLDWLLDQLEPRGEALRKLQSLGCRMDVACYWLSDLGHGGPTLSPSTMGRLAALGLEVWFDIFFRVEEDGEPDGTLA